MVLGLYNRRSWGSHGRGTSEALSLAVHTKACDINCVKCAEGIQRKGQNRLLCNRHSPELHDLVDELLAEWLSRAHALVTFKNAVS